LDIFHLRPSYNGQIRNDTVQNVKNDHDGLRKRLQSFEGSCRAVYLDVRILDAKFCDEKPRTKFLFTIRAFQCTAAVSPYLWSSYQCSWLGLGWRTWPGMVVVIQGTLMGLGSRRNQVLEKMEMGNNQRPLKSVGPS